MTCKSLILRALYTLFIAWHVHYWRALYTLFIAWHVHNREPRRARLGRGSSAFCRTSNKRSPSSSCSGLWALCQTGTSWNISFTISMIQRWWKWYWFFLCIQGCKGNLGDYFTLINPNWLSMHRGLNWGQGFSPPTPLFVNIKKS